MPRAATTILRLQGAVDNLNRITGSPTYPWRRPPGATTITAAVGCFFLDTDGSGVRLERMADHEGNSSLPFGAERHSKRALFGLVQAFAAGFELERGERWKPQTPRTTRPAP